MLIITNWKVINSWTQLTWDFTHTFCCPVPWPSTAETKFFLCQNFLPPTKSRHAWAITTFVGSFLTVHATLCWRMLKAWRDWQSNFGGSGGSNELYSNLSMTLRQHIIIIVENPISANRHRYELHFCPLNLISPRFQVTGHCTTTVHKNDVFLGGCFPLTFCTCSDLCFDLCLTMIYLPSPSWISTFVRIIPSWRLTALF